MGEDKEQLQSILYSMAIILHIVKMAGAAAFASSSLICFLTLPLPPTAGQCAVARAEEEA